LVATIGSPIGRMKGWSLIAEVVLTLRKEESQMLEFSTSRQSLSRLNARIEATADPRRRRWLSVYRDHWWGEVVGDVEAVMATMSRGPIRYSFDGHPFMVASDLNRIETYEDTRRMYQGVVDLGVKMAGPVDRERITFDDEGLIVACILTAIYPGIFLSEQGGPVDSRGFYLLRWPNVTMVRFDAAGLMMGEEIINGAPLVVRPVDKATMDTLVDGPLPL
jgi:hypothetical protein